MLRAYVRIHSAKLWSNIRKTEILDKQKCTIEQLIPKIVQ